MRTQRLIDGLNNSQKIRVIVDGVGFFTTVGGTSDIMTRKHRMAVQTALMNLAYGGGTGFGFNYQYYEGTTDNNASLVPVQVDLI